VKKNPNAHALGKLGGKAGTGKAKARDPKKMSKAGKKGAMARWYPEKAKH
jgi:general stress protein YciG